MISLLTSLSLVSSYKCAALLNHRLSYLRRESIRKGSKDLKVLMGFIVKHHEEAASPPASSPSTALPSTFASGFTGAPAAPPGPNNGGGANAAKAEEFPIKKVLDILGDVDVMWSSMEYWHVSEELLRDNGELLSLVPVFRASLTLCLFVSFFCRRVCLQAQQVALTLLPVLPLQ